MLPPTSFSTVATTPFAPGAPDAAAAAGETTVTGSPAAHLVSAPRDFFVAYGAFEGAEAASSAASSRTSRTSASSGAGYATATSAATSSSKTSSSKKTTTTKKKTSSSSTKKSTLAFLSDPKLSVEQKLMRLLAHLNAGWEADIQSRLQSLAASEDVSSTSKTSTSKSSGSGSSSQTKKKGLLGQVFDAAKTFFPAVGIASELLQNPSTKAVLKQLGGPVLSAAATALGFPQLAPALLEYGPKIVDLAAGAVTALEKESKATGTSSSSGGKSGTSSSSSTKSTGAAKSDAEQRLELMELQRLQEHQKEMFSLVSNILRSMHDTRSSIIGNIRA